MNSTRTISVLLPAQCLLLALLGWHFRHALNSDAISYLRIAEYYAEGRFELAVSGYWGPQLSWWLAGLFKLGVSPLVAARLAMAASALFFTFGSLTLFRTLKIPDKWISAGAILVALATVYWSVQFITPDLLLGGWTLIATSQMFREGRRANLLAGLFLGLAYLTKAVALPLGLLVIAGFGALELFSKRESPGITLRKSGITLMIFAIVALPWVTVLSTKYGELTFSTTARISHALTGPGDIERYHPFARGFHTPEPGRITSWEDPSRAAYNDWSPLDNSAYAIHQIKVIARNLGIILLLLTSLNLAWPVMVYGLIRRNQLLARRGDVLKLLWMIAALAIVYLPFYVTKTEQRFFYAALPLVLGGLALLAEYSTLKPWVTPQRILGCGIVPLLAAFHMIGDSQMLAGEWAADTASRMRTAQLTGSIAGSANLPGGRTGLYVSYLLNAPWHGDELNPTPESIAKSGAAFFIARRDSPLAVALAAHPGFVSQDAKLFQTSEDASRSPIIIFKIAND
jgi:hypothetical protein